MKNKLMVALMALGMGFGISSTASAEQSCRTLCQLANYHCNYTMDNALCSQYSRACSACGVLEV